MPAPLIASQGWIWLAELVFVISISRLLVAGNAYGVENVIVAGKLFGSVLAAGTPAEIQSNAQVADAYLGQGTDVGAVG